MKNLLLPAFLLLTSVAALAQLSVRPVPSGPDSYIYVKDQVLFVKGEVHLEKNNTSVDEAPSIYLRDNGQLIQGDDTALNSGSGEISVQQTSPITNAYAYYYWCSPVGRATDMTNVTMNPGNTNFGVRNLFDPGANTSLAAQMVNSTGGLNGFGGDPITVSTRWLYTHPSPGTEAEGNYEAMNGYYNAPPFYGFTMKGVPTTPVNGAQIYDFRGRPNNGAKNDIQVQGPIEGGTTIEDARLTLAGNPYPSALDLNRVIYDNPDKIPAVYFYDEDRTVDSHYYSTKPFGYGVWTPVGPDSGGIQPGAYVDAMFYIWNAAGQTSGGSNGNAFSTAHRFAPIGQGFMLVGNDPDNPADIKINNSQRRYIKQDVPNGSVFHRAENENENDITLAEQDGNKAASSGLAIAHQDNRTPQTRIYVVFDGALTRDMLLVYSDQATDGYDYGFDGPHPMGSQTDAWFPVANTSPTDIRPYVINAINYNIDKQVPITFKLKTEMKFEVKAVQEIKKPYANAFLFDSQENTYQRISGGNYSAGVFLPAGTYTDRFYIVFKNAFQETAANAATAAKEALNNVSFFQNNPAGELEVRNPERYNIKSAAIYDMTGKLVLSQQNVGDDNHFNFYTGNLSDGVYMVKLLTVDNVNIDYKTIVKN